MRLRSRSRQGWRRRRLQQVSRLDQGWRRRIPSGTSAAMSVRERLEARGRIEHLFDEDRRRVAPPPEKATTPVGWLDHERRCCSLEGATTTSSFRRVDDERRRTAGRRKPNNESGKNLRKTHSSSRVTSGYNLGCRSEFLSPPCLFPAWSTRDRKQRRLENPSGSPTIARPRSAPAAASSREAEAALGEEGRRPMAQGR